MIAKRRVLRFVFGFIVMLALTMVRAVPPVQAQAASWFVSPTGSGTDCTQANPCLPATAFGKGTHGDTIYFQGGTYTNTQPIPAIAAGFSFLGGWDGTDGALVVDPAAYPTIIDGEGTVRPFYINVTTADPVVIKGFTIRNGAGGGSDGGAIYVDDGIVTIENNSFEDNTAQDGGAIGASSDDAVVIHGNTFTRNLADTNRYGGAISLIASADVTISGNTFTDNSAQYGAAIHSLSSGSAVFQNFFLNSQGSSVVAVVSHGTANMAFYSNIIAHAPFGLGIGDGIVFGGGNTVSHTVTGNTIYNVDIGIGVDTGATVEIVNNIVVNTEKSIDVASATINGWNNLLFDNALDPYPLANPVYGDPLFVDAASNDFHIRQGSAAQDTGYIVSILKDFDGDDRPMGWGHEIGADEIPFLLYQPMLLRD
jgi:hypothetical protein